MHRLLRYAAGFGLALALLLAPMDASAQISIAPKIGSTGLGGDVAVGLTDRLAVRGGLGYFPIEFDDLEVEDNTFEGRVPEFMATAGLDLKLVGPLRVSGGLLYRSGDFELFRDVGPGNPIVIDDESFDDEGTITVAWENSTTAPFLALGLGSTVGSGVGVYLDLGVAFTGDPEVTGELTGALDAAVSESEFQAELDAINDDIPGYAEYWPFLQFGIRIGIGN